MNSELAKLIQDFNWDRLKAFNVYHIRKRLTPTWFEFYIMFFFEKKLGYKMKMPSSTYSPDECIDLKGIKKDKEGNISYCIIQCKRYSTKMTTVKEVSDFVWRTYHYPLNFPNTKMVFITTSFFTEPAIKLLEKECISYKDYRNISNICDLYPLSEFENDIRDDIKVYKKSFNKGKDIKESVWQGKLFNSEEDELLKTLKGIRYTIMKNLHESDKKKVWDDKILELLSIKRPHNLESLKNILYESDIKKDEIDKTLVHAEEYLKWIVLFSE